MTRGFTLIELLVVIAIVAVLAVAVVLVLNPAELIKQGRDTTRVSDIATLNSAIALYLSDTATPDMNGSAADSECALLSATRKVYANATTTTNSFVAAGGPTVIGLRGIGGGSLGWLPIAFSGISIGSPISILPVDPTNSGDLVFRYTCDQPNVKYELDACLESTKYMSMMDNDGGDKNSPGNAACSTGRFYETGTSLTL